MVRYAYQRWFKSYERDYRWLIAISKEAALTFWAVSATFDDDGEIRFVGPGLEMLANLLMLPVDFVTTGLEHLVQAGVLEYDPQARVVRDPLFDDRQPRKSGNATRQQRYRDRQKDKAEATLAEDDVAPSSTRLKSAERSRRYRQRKGTSPSEPSSSVDLDPVVTGVTAERDVTLRNGVTVTRDASRVTLGVTLASRDGDRDGQRDGDRDAHHETPSKHDVSRAPESVTLRVTHRNGIEREEREEREERRSPLAPRGASGVTVAPLAEPNPAAAELATGNTAALADRTETLPAVETIATTTASQRIASPSEGGAAGPGLAKARAIGVEMADGPTVAMSTHEGAVAAPQSACGKLRDKGTRRVESPFVAAAYAETIGAQTGGNYGVPRDQLITLDEALDTHGPRGDLGRRLEWLRGAVGEFARQVRADEENATRYRHGYDPKGFLKWANDGGIRRFREQMRREAAEAAAREASGAPVFDAQAEELEAAMAILEAVKQGADGPFFEGLTIEMAEARLAKAKAAFEAKQAKRQAASKRQANAEANPKQTSNGSGASEVAHG